MAEAWEFIKSAWAVIDFILRTAGLVLFPFFAIATWRLVGRMDAFVRLDELLNAPKKSHPKGEAWTPKEYSEAMADHEKAVRRMKE